jgi:hypothetical protein
VDPAKPAEGSKETRVEPKPEGRVRPNFPPVDQPPAMAITEPGLATWSAE